MLIKFTICPIFIKFALIPKNNIMKTINILLLLLVSTLLYAESSSPQWVLQRPVNSNYYIGIGFCQKSNKEYQTTAQQKALQDIALQIKSHIQSSSSLNTSSNKQNIQRDYSENIQVETNLQLEEYELVDSWENPTEYWVYYRLSKVDYQRLLERRLSKALSKGLSYLYKGEEWQAKGMLRSAATSYAKGLHSLNPVLDQDLTTLIHDSSDDLYIVLSQKLLTLFDGITLKCTNSNLEFYPLDQNIEKLKIQITQQEQPISQLELKARFTNPSSQISSKAQINAKGEAYFDIKALSNLPKKQEIQVLLSGDFLTSLKEYMGQKLYSKLMHNRPRLRIPITLSHSYSAFVNVESNSNFDLLSHYITQQIYETQFGSAASQSQSDININIHTQLSKGAITQSGIQTYQAYTVLVKYIITKTSDNSVLMTQEKSYDTQVNAALSEDSQHKRVFKKIQKKCMQDIQNLSSFSFK